MESDDCQELSKRFFKKRLYRGFLSLYTIDILMKCLNFACR